MRPFLLSNLTPPARQMAAVPSAIIPFFPCNARDFFIKTIKILRFMWNFSWQTWDFAAEDNSKPGFSEKTDEEKRVSHQFLWFPIWVHINFNEFTWISMKTCISWAQELSLNRGDTHTLSRVFCSKWASFWMPQRCNCLVQVKIFIAIVQVICYNIYEKLRRKTSYEEKDHHSR